MTRTYGSLRGYHREVCSISSGNFLLPLLVGGPDMANKGSLSFSYDAVFFYFFIKKSFSNFTDKLRLNVYFSSCASTGFNNNRKNLGPYLAGLFEGDGHI